MRGGSVAAVLMACLLAGSTGVLPAQQSNSVARRFDLRIANGKLLDGPNLIPCCAAIRAATAAGRFPIELHADKSAKARHSVLIYLEVHPR